MRIKKKFQGYSANRYSREPLEKIFAECWQEENTQLAVRNCTLDHLWSASTDESYTEVQGDDMHKLAATLIQWLGSPVGQGFLANVIQKAQEKHIPMAMFEPYIKMTQQKNVRKD
jgi:hypothetical protein